MLKNYIIWTSAKEWFNEYTMIPKKKQDIHWMNKLLCQRSKDKLLSSYKIKQCFTQACHNTLKILYLKVQGTEMKMRCLQDVLVKWKPWKARTLKQIQKTEMWVRCFAMSLGSF